MGLSKIQTFFAQLTKGSEKQGSSQEAGNSDNSIFAAYIKNNGSLDSETFSSILGFNSSRNSAQGVKLVQREVPYSHQGSVQLANIPQIPENPDDFIWWGNEGTDLRGNDASKLDLSKSEKLLIKSNIDTNTKFPSKDKMPLNYDPQKVMETGKDPGLGIRLLHEKGYTGEGVNVAIVDLPMAVTHSEFKDNITSYQEMGVDPDKSGEMHGYATTSILAGKNLGVAPKSKVTYFADKFYEQKPEGPPEKINKYIIQSLNKIGEMNKTLPKDKQVNAVSMSLSPNMQAEDYKEFQESVKNLEDSGVFVQYNDDENPNAKLRFAGLDRDPQGNPNDVGSYKVSDAFTGGMAHVIQKYKGNVLLVPAGHRTTAGPTGENDYVNYANGGVSWQVPYIVGTYSLAKQANPQLKPDEFRQTLMETGTPYYATSGELVGKIINPEKLIEEVSKK